MELDAFYDPDLELCSVVIDGNAVVMDADEFAGILPHIHLVWAAEEYAQSTIDAATANLLAAIRRLRPES
jgi:hypothetical protein